VPILRTIVHSSRALATGAKDAARLREIAGVFVRHGFGWFVAQLRLRRELQLEYEEHEVGRAALGSPETGRRLVEALTALGPTWVKFGQILSTRSDILPASILEELSSLQDAVDPIEFAEIDAQLKRNLGADYREKFASFEEEPLASASIGQVHRAVLADGKEVVVKVQRPGIGPKISSDLNILASVSGYIEESFEEARAMDLRGSVQDFAKSLGAELDYRVEADNILRFTRNFADSDQVRLPRVYEDLCTEEVLTMEFMRGRKFSELIELGEDVTPLVETYFDMSYKMLFIDGFFHGDLHPGNVFVQEDGGLALIDCGMVGRLAPRRKDKVIDIMYAVLNEDLEGVARTIYDLAIPQGPVDYRAFEADAMAIAERYLVGVPLSQVQIGTLFSELVTGATKHRVRMPSDFTMMFKAIVTTEGLAKTIAPDVDAVALARPYIMQMIGERYSPERLKQMAISDFSMLSNMARSLPRNLPMTFEQLQQGKLAFSLSEQTLEQQALAADERSGRSIRAAFSIACLLSGTVLVGVEGLPVAIWGIPWLSLVFWALAGPGILTLLKRAGLI
jgi:ubiquinone biosynthesis protein